MRQTVTICYTFIWLCLCKCVNKCLCFYTQKGQEVVCLIQAEPYGLNVCQSQKTKTNNQLTNLMLTKSSKSLTVFRNEWHFTSKINQKHILSKQTLQKTLKGVCVCVFVTRGSLMFGITVGLHHGSLDGSTCIVIEKTR